MKTDSVRRLPFRILSRGCRRRRDRVEHRLHLLHGLFHLQAGLVLRSQLVINFRQFVPDVIEGGGFGARGDCGVPLAPTLSTPKLFNLSHGAMNPTKLALKLGDEIELVSHKYFGVGFKVGRRFLVVCHGHKDHRMGAVLSGK